MKIQLSDLQRVILENLNRLDSRLGQIYLGALGVLDDRDNPERFVHSAHSIREVLNVLSRTVDIPQEDNQKVIKNDSLTVQNPSCSI